jgi:hypothetical protein
VAAAAKPEVELTLRNIERAAVQVFRVDLMRLYLLEKSLDEISGIQLHGIQPLLSLDVPLGDGRDYKNKVHKLALELAEPGAYLVVVRGGDRIATGMVLKTDLRIEAQEQCDVGRLRVNVRQGDGYLAGAHVKVVGSGDGAFRSGDTDLRGVFVADALVGLPTVIAKKGDHYAFYRGSTVHQPDRFRPAPEPAQQPAGNKPGATRKGKDFDALEQNLLLNEQNRGRQVDWLQKEVYDKKQQGVEVYRTK